MIYLPIFCKVASLALGKYDFPSPSKVTIKDVGKLGRYLITTEHNKVQNVHISWEVPPPTPTKRIPHSYPFSRKKGAFFTGKHRFAKSRKRGHFAGRYESAKF